MTEPYIIISIMANDAPEITAHFSDPVRVIYSVYTSTAATSHKLVLFYDSVVILTLDMGVVEMVFRHSAQQFGIYRLGHITVIIDLTTGKAYHQHVLTGIVADK